MGSSMILASSKKMVRPSCEKMGTQGTMLRPGEFKRSEIIYGFCKLLT
jgi:hypothetical protein